VKNRETLDGFDLIPFNAYPQRPLNCIDGYDQLTLSAARGENSFDTIQGTATDAHALPYLEKGMGTVRQSLFYQLSNRVDLFLGNRKTLSARSDEFQHAVYQKHSQAFVIAWRQLREHITTE
jgi:hypothetical protein